ncbi:MAG: hypothetical protein EOO07_24805 [Chitinophagaceae bacterium]|nr:MAG: hypothetical protein EOO07_24805 [Chitinophagaceae bacterium]
MENNNYKIYFRRIEDSFLARIDKLLGYPLERKNFKKAHGYTLDLVNPRSFNEKICWKKICDRNPLLPILADKYAIRKHIVNVLGNEVAENILIPLLYVTEDPESIDFDSLPSSFVIKSNHGSGNNILVHDKSGADRQAIIRECKAWLKMPYGVRAHEWAYEQTPRKILIEAMLKDSTGHVPPDYKFSMMHGDCVFIQVDSDRFGDFTRTLYDKSWNKIDAAWKRKPGAPIPRPEKLDEMLILAKKLAQNLDYIRVDFYVMDGRIFLGEMTNYPARGRGRFTPQAYDFELGAKWKINVDYWK